MVNRDNRVVYGRITKMGLCIYAKMIEFFFRLKM